jgi:uncharacterized membrane protein YwaF
MKWGFFTPTHILTLVLAAAMLLCLYYGLKNKSRKIQTLVLFPLSLSGIAAIVFNLLRWGEPLAYLPLHLCSINAMLLPFAVLTRNKTLCNLLLVWCLGALVALVANFEMQETELFGEAFNFYFFPHVFEFGIPVLLFKLGLAKKDPKCIGSTLTITMFLYTLVHLCNLIINRYCISICSSLRVNYMFSMEASNPLVALFHKLIPHAYWHMYPVIPIVLVYLLALYAPHIYSRYSSGSLSHHTA